MVTGDVSENLAVAMLHNHTIAHPQTTRKRQSCGPKLDCPRVNVGITGEEWNIFCQGWEVFSTGSGIDEDSASSQLFQCTEDALGDSLLRMDPGIATKTVKKVLQVMQSLAVISVSTSVLRANLLQMRQERAEAF
jgi:hypothetical protein